MKHLILLLLLPFLTFAQDSIRPPRMILAQEESQIVVRDLSNVMIKIGYIVIKNGEHIPAHTLIPELKTGFVFMSLPLAAELVGGGFIHSDMYWKLIDSVRRVMIPDSDRDSFSYRIDYSEPYIYHWRPDNIQVSSGSVTTIYDITDMLIDGEVFNHGNSQLIYYDENFYVIEDDFRKIDFPEPICDNEACRLCRPNTAREARGDQLRDEKSIYRSFESPVQEKPCEEDKYRMLYERTMQAYLEMKGLVDLLLENQD